MRLELGGESWVYGVFGRGILGAWGVKLRLEKSNWAHLISKKHHVLLPL